MSKRIAVLMGGWSAEREVSLVSGAACADALEARGHEVIRIDITRNLTDLLAALEPKPDAVFNGLHGRWGEDGNIQGVLNILGIPYTHSGVLASSVAMDKPLSKKLFEAAGIPCPAGSVVMPKELRSGRVMSPPYVVKPIDEGSSVGVHIVRDGDNWVPPGDLPEDRPVLVEVYIPGRELTVSVMGERALGVTELRPHQGFYDYTAKYTDGKTTHLCPAPIADDVARQAMDYAVAAHRVLGCRGVTRADFRYDDAGGEPGRLYMLEINTQPGMTPLSLVPEQAAHAGVSFEDLVEWMVENAACDN
ncbi:MAG: D-alanine--D-alanine ligase [Rhodospirillales bacterium]|nr:MAG: D-alanine--D-alanine ligase [Rhodospirillales bacterium]